MLFLNVSLLLDTIFSSSKLDFPVIEPKASEFLMASWCPWSLEGQLRNLSPWSCIATLHRAFCLGVKARKLGYSFRNFWGFSSIDRKRSWQTWESITLKGFIVHLLSFRLKIRNSHLEFEPKSYTTWKIINSGCNTKGIWSFLFDRYIIAGLKTND